MQHDKPLAKKFLRLILATEGNGMLIPFVGGRLTSRIDLINLKPRLSHSTLIGNLTDVDEAEWFKAWKGKPALQKTDKPRFRSEMKGYLALRGTTLAVKARTSPEAVRETLRKYFTTGFDLAVPWTAVEVLEQEAGDDALAQMAGNEDELLDALSEAALDAAVDTARR